MSVPEGTPAHIRQADALAQASATIGAYMAIKSLRQGVRGAFLANVGDEVLEAIRQALGEIDNVADELREQGNVP